MTTSQNDSSSGPKRPAISPAQTKGLGKATPQSLILRAKGPAVCVMEDGLPGRPPINPPHQRLPNPAKTVRFSPQKSHENAELNADFPLTNAKRTQFSPLGFARERRVDHESPRSDKCRALTNRCIGTTHAASSAVDLHATWVTNSQVGFPAARFVLRPEAAGRFPSPDQRSG